MDRGVGTRRARSLRGLAATLALALVLPTAAEAGPYRRGEYVLIRGQVLESGDQPLAGVTVLLESSRRSFRLSRPFKKKEDREKTDTLRVPVATDADGRFVFEDWRWDPYYNTFEIAIALPVQKAGRADFEVFHRENLTERLLQGSPVDVRLTVEDTGDLRWLKRFLDRLASEDEQRIFAEMGRPDKVESRERSTGLEISWWYFEEGKVYRFLGGELSQVTHFDPIPPVP